MKESKFFEKSEKEKNLNKEEFIKVGDRQIKLSEAEKKFMKLAEMGGGAAAAGLVFAIYSALTIDNIKRTGEPLESLPFMGSLLSAGAFWPGAKLGKEAGQGILKAKHHLQKRWESFKSQREKAKEE